MENKRITKEEMYMQMAEITSQRSTCLRLQVGAVITDITMQYILSMGYNGNYAGGPNVCDSNETGNCGCIHAELNALIKVDNRIKDKILFVSVMPCKKCSKMLINSGFSKVYYRNTYRLTDGIDLLRKTGIEVQQL